MAERRYSMAVKLKSGQIRSLDKKAEEYTEKFGFTIKRGQALEIMLSELLPDSPAPAKKAKSKPKATMPAGSLPPVKDSVFE